MTDKTPAIRSFSSFGSPISRRRLLEGTVAAAVGMSAAPTLAANTLGDGPIGGDLDYFWYEGYDMLGLDPMDAWMASAGVTMRSSYISANADVIAKLRRPGGVTWDLVGTFNGLARRLEDLVHPIRPDEITLAHKIHPIFVDERFFKTADGDWILVPFTWGRSVTNYLPDRMDPPESWFDLLKDEYRGHVGWGGGPDGGMVIAGRALVSRARRSTIVRSSTR